MKDILSLISFSLFCCLVYLANGVYVFDVYRMLQYDVTLDKLTSSFGSQRSTLNSLAVTIHTLPTTDNLVRYVVLVPAEDLTESMVEELVNKRNADGLVVLTPDLENPNIDKEKWGQLESILVKKKINGAIYFTPPSEAISLLYDEIHKENSFTGAVSWLDLDSYRLEVLPPDSSPIHDVKIHNIQGWLAGTSRGTDSPPTIAIVASYDTFGIAPGLSVGTDSNGSGVVALLELARLFSRLYRGPKTQGEYNIVFLLTGSGRMNYVGTREWLEKTDKSLLDSVHFALCLDSIGGPAPPSSSSSSPPLYLHVSRSTKDPNTKRIYDAFSSKSEEMNIPFSIIHKKINISSTEVPWQHELFSRKKVLAGSLSKLGHPSGYMGRSNIFDRNVDVSILKKNIKFVAEGLARFIYNLDNTNISVFSDEFDISSDYITSWMDTIVHYPRMMPYLTNVKGKDSRDNLIITGLEKELSKHVTDVSKKTVSLTKEDAEGYVFYDKTESIMSAYRGKPVTFDVILSICISVYCLILYTILKGPKNTWSQIKSIFTGSKYRRGIKNRN